MIKILSVGNSFSQDATRYLTELSECMKVDLRAENLYIGGCSLETHYNNALSGAEDYDLELHGSAIGKISLKNALIKENWDFITLQQASHLSINYSSYQPYLNELAKIIKEFCPNAKLVIHETWAYEDNSERLCKELNYKTAADMLTDIKAAYEKAAEEIRAFGIIRSGELFERLSKNGISKLHRDTFHASLGAGRYALALLWYKFFTKNDINDISFNEFDEPITEGQIEIIKKSVNEII